MIVPNCNALHVQLTQFFRNSTLTLKLRVTVTESNYFLKKKYINIMTVYYLGVKDCQCETRY